MKKKLEKLIELFRNLINPSETPDTPSNGIIFTPEIGARIDEMREAIGPDATQTEVFRRALALYDMTLEHVSDGGTLVLRSPSGEEEVLTSESLRVNYPLRRIPDEEE